MFRSTPIFSLVAELLVAALLVAGLLVPIGAAAAPKPSKFERCVSGCDAMSEKMEKTCKAQMPGGKCDGRGRALVDDLDKKCKDSCEKKRGKK